jgi:hypothetical protein
MNTHPNGHKTSLAVSPPVKSMGGPTRKTTGLSILQDSLEGATASACELLPIQGTADCLDVSSFHDQFFYRTLCKFSLIGNSQTIDKPVIGIFNKKIDDWDLVKWQIAND